MKYLILIGVSLIIIIFDALQNLKRKKKLYIKKQLNLNNKLILLFDKLTNKHVLILKLKDKYIKKLGVINGKGKQINSLIVNYYILGSTISSLFIGAFLMSLFSMWYAVLFITIMILCTLLYSGMLYINIKINKIYNMFPFALQIFIDAYMTNKNIKNALDNSFTKMPDKIQPVFEKLSRELSSTKEYKKPIMDFADGLSYIWAYAFAELLLISIEETGDITEDLLFLNELVNDEIKESEKTKTELGTNKIVFIILNIAVLVFFLINISINPIAKELYFYTSTGNTLFVFWFTSIIIGCCGLVISDHI